MKITDSVLSLTSPSTGLSGIHYSTLKVLGSILKDQKKYNKTATFYGCHTALNTHCWDYKKSGKVRTFESNQSKFNTWKLQTRFYWVCSWGIMKMATSLTPRTGLSGFQFSTLKVLESLIPNDQKKYNNTEMKSGRLFAVATQHLTPSVVIMKIQKTYPLGHGNPNKRQVKKQRSKDTSYYCTMTGVWLARVQYIQSCIYSQVL